MKPVEEPSRRRARLAWTLALLAAELFVAVQFIPSYTSEQIGVFMLFSQGLAFAPLFAILIVAAIAVAILMLIAMQIASVLVPTHLRDGDPHNTANAPADAALPALVTVHLFRGSGRVLGFTSDLSGTRLPPQLAPWSHCKSLEMRPGERMAGIDVDGCLADMKAFGVHITDASVRITEQAVQEGGRA